MNNPFQPGVGEIHPLVAGRADELQVLANRLNRITGGSDGSCVILCGPRGNGKTVLLDEIKRQARPRGIQVLELALKGPDPDPASVAAQLLDSRGQLEETARTTEGGVRDTKGRHEGTACPPASITATLWTLAGTAPTVLLVDEAHGLPPELGRTLLIAIKTCVRKGLPLLAAFAGTPALPASFGRMRAGFWGQAKLLRIGRLESDDAVRQTLSVPAEESGLPIDDDALDLLVRESQRYPPFMRMLGERAWDVAAFRQEGPRRIVLADAEAGVRQASEDRESFHEDRRTEIIEHGVLDEAEAVSVTMVERGTEPRLTWQEMKETLKTRTDKDPGWVQDRLQDLGLIWALPGWDWEPGIPSLCTYLKTHIGR